jgi:hypothetical protein
MDALTQLLANAVKDNPAILSALLPQLAAVQSAKAAPPAKGKGKANASEYVNVAEMVLTDYLTVSLSVKKTGEGKKGYAILEFNNPKRQGGGKGAYGKVWLYRAEFIALVNWLRDAKFNPVLAQFDAAGLTNA